MNNSRLLKMLVSLGTAGSAVFVVSTVRTNREQGKIVDGYAHAATAVESSKVLSSWDYNWDKRDPLQSINPSKLKNIERTDLETADLQLAKLLAEYTPTATRHLLFIRHGQYDMEFKEDEKRKLTTLGQEQAVYTGIRLRDLGIDYDRVIESSMTRAIETSELIRDQLKDVKVVRTDLLREGSPIKPEPNFRSWRSDVLVYTDGPRIESAFRKYVHRADTSQKQDSYEVVVCHANVIRYIACRALQLPPEAWLRLSLRHGSITWLTIRSNGYVSLRCLGESGHIPPDKLTVE